MILYCKYVNQFQFYTKKFPCFRRKKISIFCNLLYICTLEHCIHVREMCGCINLVHCVGKINGISASGKSTPVYQHSVCVSISFHV